MRLRASVADILVVDVVHCDEESKHESRVLVVRDGDGERVDEGEQFPAAGSDDFAVADDIDFALEEIALNAEFVLVAEKNIFAAGEVEFLLESCYLLPSASNTNALFIKNFIILLRTV